MLQRFVDPAAVKAEIARALTVRACAAAALASAVRALGS
jgi:hypothetical protein